MLINRLAPSVMPMALYDDSLKDVHDLIRTLGVHSILQLPFALGNEQGLSIIALREITDTPWNQADVTELSLLTPIFFAALTRCSKKEEDSSTKPEEKNKITVTRPQKELAALYRLSKELSGFLRIEEIFERAFCVIRDELGIKRMWIGLLNDTNTRIVEQAAYGHGWRRRLGKVNIEIVGTEHPIAQVLTYRKPLIVQDLQKTLKKFGVSRPFPKTRDKSVGLMPLAAGGKVLGVIAFELLPAYETRDSQLDLLRSLASEIAPRLLAKKLEEHVSRSEKMRTAGLLAAGIAHNFNNLLQAIMGQSSLLEMQSGDKARVEKASKIINDAANKGASLVKQLISFAHLEEPYAELTNINAIIERSAPELKRTLQQDQELIFHLADELPRVFADPRQIMRILRILVTNSQEALDTAHGSIHIYTNKYRVDEQNTDIELEQGDYVQIKVQDNGRGMNTEALSRCFEPFYTTKNVDPTSGLSMSGAGLGLAAAYALSLKNGGKLSVESQLGRGTTFTLSVPIAPDEISSRRAKKNSVGKNSGKTIPLNGSKMKRL